MSTPAEISEVASSLGSNQSGLASLSDEEQGQVLPASSQISAESGATPKLCDYMGLSEVSSAPADIGVSRNEWQKNNNNLQETELTLGPFQALPCSQHADNGAPFQPNVVSFLPTAGERKNERFVLPECHRGNHFSSSLRDFGDHGAKNDGLECEKDEKSQLVMRNSANLDFGVGLFPQSLAFEEVGENKLFSSNEEMERQSRAKPQKRCLEYVYSLENVERGMGTSKDRIEEIKQRKCNAIVIFERTKSDKLQEVTTTKNCHSHTSVTLNAAANSLKKHEIDSPEESSASRELNPSKISSLPSISGASTFADILKTPAINTKRVFSEVFGFGSVMNNTASKIDMSENANDESEAKVHGKCLLPPLFPWNLSKHSVSSWVPEVDRPCKGFSSAGQFIGYLSPEYRITTLFEWPVGPNSSNPGYVNGPGSIDGDDASVIPPRTPVGWPPVQSFRKNSIPTPHPKSILKAETTAPSATTKVHLQPKCAYVKVYMDGLPIGRKVDLHIHDSYGKLYLVLEDMFKDFMGGNLKNQQLLDELMASSLIRDRMKLFSGSEYVLAYEDKDGDLMLVGDVPWRMFKLTVKRLRIMKGSEAIGITPKIMKETMP